MCKGPGEETAGQVQGTGVPAAGGDVGAGTARGPKPDGHTWVSVMCREMGSNWDSAAAGFLASRVGELPGVWQRADPWA